MTVPDPNVRRLLTPLHPVLTARPPKRSRLEFLRAALRPVHRKPSRRAWWDGDRRPVTAEDIRIHTWLGRRLARLPRRRGWWPRLLYFLSHNALTRWLVPRRR